jgi:BASS family bile acid:Na+ symporter
MAERQGWFAGLGQWVHQRLVWLIVLAYAVAGVWPGLGLHARHVVIASVHLFPAPIPLTLPMVLLAGLLFNAGLGLEASALGSVLRRPQIVLIGLLANLIVPLGLIALLSQLFHWWHNAAEIQNLLVGLAVVAAMPIAGSSTAWAQNANGNLALSLGLVIFSTLFSPLTTPLALAAVRGLTSGQYAEALANLGGNQTGAFLLLCVVLPSLAGILMRQLAGRDRIARAKPVLKLANALILLFLCYANAAVALPQVVANPDWDFLLVVLGVAFALCGTAFAAGWALARWLKTDEPQQRSLMFGLGMNNNGTGLVLASASLAAFPEAVLPVLTYNLVQHLVAGTVHRLIRHNESPAGACPLSNE